MMINALNSGARVFMADLEDALSPTRANVIGGQRALIDAVRRELAFESPEGKSYRLNERIATLLVRPRGWHLVESGVLVDGVPVSASLFDFGLNLFHIGAERLRRGSGPYLYRVTRRSRHRRRPTLAISPGWFGDQTVGGRGWIAIGLVIFAQWSPIRAALGAYLFGAIFRFILDIQGVPTIQGVTNPFQAGRSATFFLEMLPYLFVIVVVIIGSREALRRRVGAPATSRRGTRGARDPVRPG